MDKDCTIEKLIEKLERDLEMMEAYVFELEKENEALTKLVLVLQSRLNRKKRLAVTKRKRKHI